MKVDYYDIFKREDITIEVHPSTYKAYIEIDRLVVEYDTDGNRLDENIAEKIASRLRRKHFVECECWIDDTGCGPGPRYFVVFGFSEKEVENGIRILEQELRSNASLEMRAFLMKGAREQDDQQHAS